MLRTVWLLAAFACLASPVLSASAAGEGESGSVATSVVVKTLDGRDLTGAVDSRTDGDSLWLRLQEQQIVMTLAISWDEIVSARVDEKTIEPAALQEAAAKLATPGPTTLIEEAIVPPSYLVEPFAMASGARRARVRNVEIVDAQLINLDRDVEPDGLQVTIAAIGDDGLPLAVRGNLRAELAGERRPAATAGVYFGELDRWSERVEPEDFVDGAACYTFRFRRTAPQWQFDLLPDALLTVKLSAAGHGNYAASAPVILRKINPLRDNLQLLEGTRFLPQEIHGRRPSDRFGPQNGLWLQWMP
jgi:hypothetical protein